MADSSTILLLLIGVLAGIGLVAVVALIWVSLRPPDWHRLLEASEWHRARRREDG